MMKHSPIVLQGSIIGRSRANRSVDVLGNPLPVTADTVDVDVTLTIHVPVPGARPVEFSMRFDTLPARWLEIGDPVTVTVASPEPDTVVISSDANIKIPDGGLAPGNVQVGDKTEPYSIATAIEEATAS